MSWLRAIVCRLVGHRGVRTITDAELFSASMDSLGFQVTGQRWDCARCGSCGIKAKGYSR